MQRTDQAGPLRSLVPMCVKFVARDSSEKTEFKPHNPGSSSRAAQNMEEGVRFVPSFFFFKCLLNFSCQLLLLKLESTR